MNKNGGVTSGKKVVSHGPRNSKNIKKALEK
jgi:hypothetical protein